MGVDSRVSGEVILKELHDLHVGLVGPLPPPSGGMANQTKQLAELLRCEGVTVSLIQTNAPYRPVWAGRLKGIRALFRLIPYLYQIWRSAKQVQLFHVMANSGWSWHLFAVPVIWIGWVKRKPVIINYRGGEAEAFFSRSFRWIRPSLKKTQLIVVPSGFLHRVFNKFGFETIIIPNIINLDRFTANVQREERAQAAPHIVVTRNLELIYDVATVIRAFDLVRTRIPTVRLTVAGSGPERSALEQQVAELGLSACVHFTGRLDNEKIATLYQRADVMVNASLVDNMPISILEALASGVPVVSSNAGGIPYLVTHKKNALLVAPQDPTALADAVLQVLCDQNLAQQLVEEGLQLVQEFSWSNVKQRLFAVYQQVLSPADWCMDNTRK